MLGTVNNKILPVFLLRIVSIGPYFYFSEVNHYF